MELYEREKALEERERKLELREIELEKISYKLAVTCQTKVNAQEINEQLEVGQLMRRGSGNVLTHGILGTEVLIQYLLSGRGFFQIKLAIGSC